jgi:gas vesicle protein
LNALEIVIVVAAVTLAALFVAFLLTFRTQQKRVAAMTPAERALRDAEKQHAAAVAEKQAALKAATKAHKKAVNAAERDVHQAERHGTKRLGSVGTVTAWEHEIRTDGGLFAMTPEVTATVQSGGELLVSSRASLTRIAGGALLGGPVGAIAGGLLRKDTSKDLRELYLLVEGKEFATLVDCNPDEAAKVRQFATAINLAAKVSLQRATERAEKVAVAQTALAGVVADTRAVDAAQENLDGIRADTGAVDAARREVEAEGWRTPAGEEPW